MSLQDWERNGWLTAHRTSREEIHALLDVVDRDLADSAAEGLSADWRMNIAYNAALQAATAALADAPKSARIAFADHGAISDWQPDGDHALWLRGIGKQWYHAELMGFCAGLDTANAIGFHSNPTGEFDRFSSIVVRGHDCPVRNLTESAPPPKHKPKKHG